ncbi:hypothetical protein K435DRAFT_804739 [Dendrothele bispora CBS 962.96]|uniref:Uncharacterized protein n=1 Tax=Dendrothele bispora (strain CBS 962.96) TaxID=1314807 RepID=A0A4S8LDU1_DENBC|nr:hypothetical protein K435DRAFT_804739 [Dendrothele bispora CBS 962.96]
MTDTLPQESFTSALSHLINLNNQNDSTKSECPPKPLDRDEQNQGDNPTNVVKPNGEEEHQDTPSDNTADQNQDDGTRNDTQTSGPQKPRRHLLLGRRPAPVTGN